MLLTVCGPTIIPAEFKTVRSNMAAVRSLVLGDVIKLVACMDFPITPCRNFLMFQCNVTVHFLHYR